MGLLLFNLAVNAVGSFAGAAALVALAVRLLRVPAGQWSRWFLVVPLAKVVFDAARGIPQGSFFWQRLQGVTQEQGSFALGLGLQAPLLPALQLRLGARAGGLRYDQSAAEPLSALLGREVGPWAPGALGALALAVGLSLLLLRAAAAARGALRLRGALGAARRVERRALRLRSVDVLVSPLLDGSPCAGGLLRPWVCLPERVFDALSRDEREAVILHEVAHIERLDLLLLPALALVADLFWFVPGLRPLCRAVAAQGELAADQRALERGACPLALASALVHVASTSLPAPSLALLPPRPTLAVRVRLLLDGLPSSPFASLRPSLRLALVAWVAASALVSSTFGNRLPSRLSLRGAFFYGELLQR